MDDEKEERRSAADANVAKDAPPSNVRRRSLNRVDAPAAVGSPLAHAAPAAAPAPELAVALKANALAVSSSTVEKAEQREADSRRDEATKDTPTSRRRLSTVTAAVLAANAFADSGASRAARTGSTPAAVPSPSHRARRPSATNAIDALGQHNFYVKSELRAKARAEADEQIEAIRVEAEEQIGKLHAEARTVWEEVREGKAEFDRTMGELQERKERLRAEVARKEAELGALQEEKRKARDVHQSPEEHDEPFTSLQDTPVAIVGTGRVLTPRGRVAQSPAQRTVV
eukprot:7022697-Prymnesium_polylepis.1